MRKSKIIGWSAMAVCALGYGAMAVLLILGKTGQIDMTQAMVVAIGAGVLGEAGLWVGAGCLGFTIFRKRKALFDRVFGKKPTATPQV